jgi:hypothetical protein
MISVTGHIFGDTEKRVKYKKIGTNEVHKKNRKPPWP